MNIGKITLFLCLITSLIGFSQKNTEKEWEAGFKTIQLIDSSRNYKPGTSKQEALYYRPIDLDLWYPSIQSIDGLKSLKFGDLFQLFEDRANKYQDETDYIGFIQELAQFYVAELGVGGDGSQLLEENQ